MWRKPLRMVGVALTDFTRNNCPYMAAGIAYWTLFSLFPLSLAAISLLGFLHTTPGEQRSIVDGIVKLVPVSVGYLSGLLDEVARGRGALGGIAIVVFLWTGSAVFSAVRKGVNHAWHIRMPHYFLLERFIDFVMLLGVASLAFVQVAFTTNLFGLSSLADSIRGSSVGVIVRILLELVAMAVTFGAFALLYRFVPNTRVAWRDVWIGAAAGALLFHGVKIGFAWFIGRSGSLNLVYGSLGAIMAVLVWAYLSSIAIMLGAQLAYTYSGVFGSKTGSIILPDPRPRESGNARQRTLRGVLAALSSLLLPPRKDRQ